MLKLSTPLFVSEWRSQGYNRDRLFLALVDIAQNRGIPRAQWNQIPDGWVQESQWS